MSVLEVVRRLHVYNAWADEQVLAAMDRLTPDDLSKEAPVAFGTLRGALWHSLAAQLGWLQIGAGFDTWSRANVRDISSVGSHAEMMDKLVGYQRMREITARATIKEGYGA